MTHYGTAAILPAIWTLLALIGIIVCIWALNDSLTDWALQRKTNGTPKLTPPINQAYELTARRDVFNALGYGFSQFMAFVIGAYAL